MPAATTRKGALVACGIGFADRRERVILVTHEQEVAPCPLRMCGNSGDSLEHGTMEVQLEHHAERAREAGVQAHGKVQGQNVA